MTAKEILYKKCFENNDGFLSGQIRWLEEAMKEYADEKCKEQRDNCFVEANKHNPHISDWGNQLLQKILDAPKPIFD